METIWLTTMKPSFQTAWLALPPKETHQVLEKISLLSKDPAPDGKVKKQLKYINGKLHRIRCGDYRIFYTFKDPYISLLALVRRSEDTYDEEYDTAFLGGLDNEIRDVTKPLQPDWERIFAPLPTQKRALPTPITEELLTQLHIPQTYYIRLMQIHTQEDLLDCPEVPDEILLRLFEAIVERPLVQVLKQPDYILQEVDDLQRFREGELLDFLLKLSKEQEDAAKWAKDATGPTQVKGNPGTGKSTVALYRIRSLLERLRQKDIDAARPHILYTTYTNALVESSRQLLAKLLGDDACCVEVTTADKLVAAIVGKEHKGKNQTLRIAESWTLSGALARAIQQFQTEAEASYVKSVAKLSHEYILGEILQLLIARNITAEEYLSIRHTGRGRLDTPKREAILQIYTRFQKQLETTRQKTWEQVRLEAEKIFDAKYDNRIYDAVIVDEAQDLDPSVIRLLVKMCSAVNRFFITADANQSIYNGEFSWSDIHESLKFQGRRTTKLKTNYRSTRQISEAAQFYLTDSALETERIESIHMYNGPLPLVRKVDSEEEEIVMLANFLPSMARESGVFISSCAILCPTQKKGIQFAEGLRARGIRAKFMTREETNLKFSGIKVLTLHSSKGLEFPIVALAGFKNSRYDYTGEDTQIEGQEEVGKRSKRTIFVGMTRAMHVLLFLVPSDTTSPLLTNFDSKYWNIMT